MLKRPSVTWSIVLAGGEGERTRPFIERWLGRHRPKQYCTFVGTRSLLQHTVDRADQVSATDRRVTVVARGHRREATAQLSARRGRLIYQPANRGTAAGVFLPLAHVRALDPDAIVAIYPADHFVWPEARFTAAIGGAIAAVRACPDRVVLLGVAPDSPETDYGWIVPDRAASATEAFIQPVKAFREKPSQEEATALMEAGALWNTLITIARVETLWQMGRRSCPEVMARFDEWSAAIGTRREAQALEGLYVDMPDRSFAADVLEPSAAQLATFELPDVLWSDWGRPERIMETLATIGRVPAFPPDAIGWLAQPQTVGA